MLLAGCAGACVGLIWYLQRASRSPRGVESPVPEAALAEPTLVRWRFAWPDSGAARVSVEAREDGSNTATECFELRWHTRPSGELVVEAFPLASVTLAWPECLVASDGRSASMLDPGTFTGLSLQPPLAARTWREGLAPRAPTLAELWYDWVACWIDPELAALDEGSRAAVHCRAWTDERVAVELRSERPLPAGDGLRASQERTVEAELWRADLRPLTVRIRERSRWFGADVELRSMEEERRYTFDWSLPPSASLLTSCELPCVDEAPEPQRGEYDREHVDLVERSGRHEPLRVRTWQPSFARDRVDLLVVGDGYTRAALDSGTYGNDVDRILGQLFAEPPFSWYREAFDVRALFLESHEPGCDDGPGVDVVDTALDTGLVGDSGLEVRDVGALYRLVAAVGGADLVLVLVDTDREAGLGRGRVATTPARTSDAAATAAHEIGHAFAALGHECRDAAEPDPPWARERRGHFLELPGAGRFLWFREDASYRARWSRCRMRSCDEPFCPVCSEALARVIHAECGLAWDDAAFHEAHPLALWSE